MIIDTVLQIGRRSLCLVLALAIAAEPSFALAQEGYGQAIGQRRQTNLPLRQQGTSSFNQSSPSGGGSVEDMRAMKNRSGMPAESFPVGDPMMGAGYQVHLLGQVSAPGTYRFTPSIRMAEAIDRAGGIARVGSQRSIELRRGGRMTRYDLFRFWQAGDLSQNPFLLDNDVIYVPFSTRSVEIQGPVKSSGVFELSSREKNISDLIKLVGGYTAGVSHQSPIVVIRYEGHEKRLLEIPNIELDLKRFVLEHGDIVVVPHILTDSRRFDYNVEKLPADNVFYPSFNDNVFVLGAVQLPGAYPFSTNYTVRDYMGMAGMDRNAKTKRVRIVTSEGKKIYGSRLARYQLSPGDTIVVPERALSANSVLGWYNAIANSIITGFTLRELIRR